ncbi:hypothetical protein Tco_1286496, partial [Tanacetum coccineum]
MHPCGVSDEEIEMVVLGCGCGGGGVGCGGTAAGEEGRVRESGSGDRVDPLMGIIFGIRRKNPAGKVFRRWLPVVGGGGVAGEEGGEGRVLLVC